jgi:hypothetical protein
MANATANCGKPLVVPQSGSYSLPKYSTAARPGVHTFYALKIVTGTVVSSTIVHDVPTSIRGSRSACDCCHPSQAGRGTGPRLSLLSRASKHWPIALAMAAGSSTAANEMPRSVGLLEQTKMIKSRLLSRRLSCQKARRSKYPPAKIQRACHR